jgi:hypothetical protein
VVVEDEGESEGEDRFVESSDVAERLFESGERSNRSWMKTGIYSIDEEKKQFVRSE